jgi:hypothetical protein
MAKKTHCPISRGQFRAKAKAVTVVINGVPLIAEAREFSTKSLGWYLNGKTSIEIDGVPVSVQIGLNMTIVGSKELPEEPPAAGPAGAPHGTHLGTAHSAHAGEPPGPHGGASHPAPPEGHDA